MTALPKPNHVSPAEYLRLENDRADDGERCEYNNGYIYAMAGASRTHNLLSGYLFAQLFMHLRGKPCQVFQSDMKVAIDTLGDTRYYYPDVQVSCEEEKDAYINRAPCLIIEVLSVTTVQKDRIEKLNGYRLIPSLQEYVLCSQDSPFVELYRRRTEWTKEQYISGQVLHLESVDLKIAIDELYSFFRVEQ
ncbi:MAG: Uma2 family endonuclease [Thiofilum sp.]|uniref:Uma2 family endonuclease n=1 Tax=Thiofilum sp. TaxID=2212733 RepID=UPI0025D7E75B|nr:Uma2 family endonuclease [Thiofilum sp.]MBK8452281.1 Uma2 family endonuclease [Thiofilum sp.]